MRDKPHGIPPMTKAEAAYYGVGLRPSRQRVAIVGEAGPEHIINRRDTIPTNNGLIAFTHSRVITRPTPITLDPDIAIVPQSKVRQPHRFNPGDMPHRLPYQPIPMLHQGYVPKEWLSHRPIGREVESASQVDPTRRMQFRYRVVDLNEPIASNRLTGEINPHYDPSLQPRQRERAASQQQIENIAKHLEPSTLLNPQASWAEGPPIVAGGMVESGNARMLALRRSAEIAPTRYEAYREQLIAQAQGFGLDPNQIRQIQRPVLVRERLTPLEGEQRLRFVSEANASGVARMGAAEQARADARLIPATLFANLDVTGDIPLAETLRKRNNLPVVRGFFERLPETERAALMTAQGELSAEGVSRLERAMFSYALPGQSGERLSRLVFEEGETLDRLPLGIRQALPSLGKMQAMMIAGHRKGEYAIGEDLAAVVEKMRDIRQMGLSVDDYLRQHKMLGELSPLQEQLMSQLHERRASGRQVAELINAYAGAVERTPAPGQTDMFGNVPDMEITREGLLRAALQEVGGRWHELQQSAAGPQPAPEVPQLAARPVAAPPNRPTLPDSDPVAEFMARRAAARQKRNTSPQFDAPIEPPPTPEFPRGISVDEALDQSLSQGYNAVFGGGPPAPAGGAGGGNKPPRKPPIDFATPETPERPHRRNRLSAWEAMDIARDSGPQAVDWSRVDWRVPDQRVQAQTPMDRYQEQHTARLQRQEWERIIGPEQGQQAVAEAIATGQQGFSQAQRAKEILAEAQPLYGQWLRTHQEFTGGSPKQQRELAPIMNQLAEQLSDLRDEFKELTPAIKESRDQLKAQAADYKQAAKDYKELMSLTSKELREVRAQLGAPGLAPSDKATLEARERELATRLRRETSHYREAVLEAASLGEQERFMRLPANLGVAGVKPVKTPPSFGQEAGGILRQTLSPQSLFYGMSNLDQLRYSMWMPLLQARDTYQQSEFTRGQMLYSLGAGAMGDIVGRDRANQAARADAWTRVGSGVNQALQPIDDWITRTLRGQQGQEGQDIFSSLGYYGTWGALGITGLLGAKTFGLDRLAMAALRHSGQAVANSRLVAGMLPRFALPSAGGLSGGLGRAAGAAGFVTAPFEGINLGAMGYDVLNTVGLPEGQRRFSDESGWGIINKGVASIFGVQQQLMGRALLPFMSDEGLRRFGQRSAAYASAVASEENSPMATFRRLALMPGALTQKGLLSAQEYFGLISPEQAKRAGATMGQTYQAIAEQGFGSTMWNALTGQSILPRGSQPTTKENPIPVAITRIENPDDLVKALGQASARAAGLPLDQYQFSEDQLRQVVKEFAESSGLDFAQLRDMRGQGYRVLERATTMAVQSGLDPEMLVSYFAKAPGAAGYLPGGQASLPFLNYISQGKGLTDLQNRMAALQATSREAQFAGFTPMQQVGIAARYQEIAQQEGEFRASRELSKLIGGDQYDFSDLARRAGRPDLALMDEQGRPMYQAEMWAIQDRQREWQDTTQQTRQAQELEWQQQRLDLEERFWDFRQKRREEDFTFQNRQFELTRKQMEYSISREEKAAQMQERYQERQFTLSKQIFDLQTKYQREDFDKQEQRLGVQRAWQLEDFAWNRESLELQAGWQQEDLQRALRYSSGRERMDIRRQMERAGIMADRSRTEMDREEARATVRYGWAEEDLGTARQRFEEMRELQVQQMELSRQYWAEQKQFAEEDRAQRKAMMEEQLTLMTDRHNALVAAYNEETQLINEQHEMERGQAEERLQWAAQDIEEAKRRAAEEKQIIEWQRQAIENQQQFNMLMTLGWDDAIEKAKDLKDIHQEIVKQANEWARVTNSSGGGSYDDRGSRTPPNVPMRTYAEGGPIYEPTFALLGERGQEYVVPSGGALVLREGNSEQTQLLRQAVAFLGILATTMQSGGGKIVVDLDELRRSGFVHVEDLNLVYP